MIQLQDILHKNCFDEAEIVYVLVQKFKVGFKVW